MVVTFYDKSPSRPSEQLARLRAPTVLLQARIPSVVWGENALAIVHRVPTGLFESRLLVDDADLYAAAEAICARLPYSVAPVTEAHSQWREFKFYNADTPHVFEDGKTAVYLKHHNTEWALRNTVSSSIPLRSNFDLHDPARTCFNSDPPSPDSRDVRFPSLHAYFDALVDAFHEPPHPFIHRKFQSDITCHLAYLSLYTLSHRHLGACTLQETWGKPAVEQELTPECYDILNKIRPENRPFLIRFLLEAPILEYEKSIIEREEVRKDERDGLPYTAKKLKIPWCPIRRQRGTTSDPSPPRLTPHLIRRSAGQFGLDWRPLAKYASLARQMLR
ncbi:hypothetical protein CYLTODRAFT_356155 [Cylindrobasidium torrendii FP15055 ss-10]|uniref:Uncharacterized protein n=1 Tax=Cylindrobasidium torrendii FP15055 ss-10 TaxID=1314674 RepID=A0A0D7B6M0_9AGAR|nr:hypothetical protein CYLTODRAFT_356155 [Cylindrobasidium torrendii FP15055 ss-10]